MEITKSEFITSLPAYRDFPGRGLPEIAFAGRSNVGKSSLLNSLTRRKALAKVSATPGKTRKRKKARNISVPCFSFLWCLRVESNR